MGFGLCPEMTNLNSIAAAIRQIYLSNASSWKLDPGLFKKRSCVLKVCKSADLNPQDPYSLRPGRITDYPKFNVIGPIARHIKGLGSCQREIQYPSFCKGPPVIDPHGDMTTRGQGMDNRDGTERQRPMRRSQTVHVIPLAIGRLVTVKSWSIPRSHPALYESDWISREPVDARGGPGTALKGYPNEQANRDYESKRGSGERLWPHRLKLVERLVAENR